mmetsp:Transcript_50508/g.119624  ORF Transcript_50508/g.119624 Transcript_50508/m.119624 type:complete len:325 (-) Transcript_50508:1094-2068(-)
MFCCCFSPAFCSCALPVFDFFVIAGLTTRPLLVVGSSGVEGEASALLTSPALRLFWLSVSLLPGTSSTTASWDSGRFRPRSSLRALRSAGPLLRSANCASLVSCGCGSASSTVSCPSVASLASTFLSPSPFFLFFFFPLPPTLLSTTCAAGASACAPSPASTTAASTVSFPSLISAFSFPGDFDFFFALPSVFSGWVPALAPVFSDVSSTPAACSLPPTSMLPLLFLSALGFFFADSLALASSVCAALVFGFGLPATLSASCWTALASGIASPPSTFCWGALGLASGTKRTRIGCSLCILFNTLTFHARPSTSVIRVRRKMIAS